MHKHTYSRAYNHKYLSAVHKYTKKGKKSKKKNEMELCVGVGSIWLHGLTNNET